MGPADGTCLLRLRVRHQRPQPEKQKTLSGIDDWYRRGVDTSKVAKKWKPGSCENCGAEDHIKKDCFDRPRKVGARWNNKNIAPNSFAQPSLSTDYDGKRDRWAGYDPAEHRAIVEEYQKIEDAKREIRAEKLNTGEDDGGQDSDKDEDKYVDEVDMPGTKVDSKQRITVRNLRIREDTAKYLRNLDPNSAYYDPKTRSMRDNPYDGKSAEVDYQGENFVRFTGDTSKHANAQLFAWDAYEKGVDVHLLAEPTKLELLKQEYDKKRDELKNEVKSSIIERYGGEEHLKQPDLDLVSAQSEHYVEYSRSGKVIKGQEKQIIRSRYEEDVFMHNHTSVWGSWWSKGQWGYKCCHSYSKNSYCTGEAGIAAAAEAAQNVTAPSRSGEVDEKEEPKKKSKKQKDESSSSDSSSSSEDEEDEEEKLENTSKSERKSSAKKEKRKRHKENLKHKKKLKRALKKEEEHQREVDRLMTIDERKRPYNSMYQVKEPTAEELEAFQMKRRLEEDPMLQFNLYLLISPGAFLPYS
ncbi:Similar to Slu7: Pre-mRNA-splicing factor SLU7 (Mus musculus) [Cotesia congregata]|uniref:Pre-mRNA-splicing factor SLU7 n=1 Tax=Cotesia congregata TaxID=51543 RepID=A0A8J2HB13_COTCN|nr:Similar to Slu7: Pre-mRNA-splicing factor SLU7 (Mus musculus) [Cotesia congregata]